MAGMSKKSMKNNKPRVAVVLPYFGRGGAETMVSRLVSQLDLECVDAEVICIYGTKLDNELEKAIVSHGIPICYIGKKKGFSLGATFRLGKELSSFHPTIIHTHLSASVYCAPWVLTHRVRMLHTVHNTPEYELIRPKRIIMRFMYKLKKAIPVAISREIQSMLVSYYKLRTKPELIYNPVNVSRFSIVKSPHDGIVIVSAGRLCPQKNQKLLIDAFKEVVEIYDNVSLILLGDGPMRKEIEEYIATSGLSKRVTLTGNVDNVEEYFSKADIFALSSLYEGLPLVILEAMAAGLPIVSTNVGGIRDIVSDNGILVESQSLSGLKAALLDLIEDERKRKIMGEKSYKSVLNYDSSIISQQYVKLYEKYSSI